jgi:hypothetical protein
VSQARFQKQQREKAKRERAAAKSARREQRQNDAAEQAAETPTSEDEAAAIVAELAVLHASFDDGEIEFDDFEARRTELISHLNI